MKTKSRWLLSIITLLFCVATFVGTTFAWFTDSVTSSNNIIASGTLDVEMHWATTLDSTDWKNVETDKTPIFNNKNWEPGYTEVRYIKVKNMGTLAFKYSLAVIPNGRVGALAEVIDVYYVVNPTENLTSASVSALPSVGTLKDVIGTHKGGGVLLPKTEVKAGFYSGEIIVAVAFRLPTSVGNFYQGSSVGDSFSIQIVATQYGYESDSFDPDYDAGAQFPAFGDEKSASAPVTPTADNKVPAGGVSLTNSEDKISATVPEGVLLESGATALTLTVNKLDESNSNVVLDETEVLLPLDVHIDGVSANNTVPMTVLLEEVAPIGLNVGNFKLYHVENDATSVMTAKDSIANLTDHNDFFYDPATGNITLYIASFSEVAVVADTLNPWTGNFDFSWYANPVTDENGITTYSIANADQLAAFGAIVGGMDGQTRDAFTGDIVKLISDINLGDIESANNPDLIFYPIGYYNNKGYYEKKNESEVESTVYSFEGTFDGNGHTIANFYQNTWEMFGDYNSGYAANSNHYDDAMGLFGYVVNGMVKNLTVDNFSSDGEFTPTGVIAAYAVNSTFTNIAITNCNPRVYNTGNGGIVGIGGNSDDPDTYKLTFTNITIDNSNKITALWGSWDVACGGLVGMFRGAGHVYMTNCHVAAQIDVYNDVCGNYQYYWYRYSGMMVGTNKNMTTDDKGYTVPETDKFHAENCTVHFGNWNDYYYCELVANSLASYTHDHQFSRLTQITSLNEIYDGENWLKTGNFLLISGNTKTCYHIVNKNGTLTQHLHTDAGEETVNGETVLKEDKQIVYLPFNQLFTGYGWGVKHIPVYNGEDYAFDGITILDREVADSVVKFEKADTAQESYVAGTTVTIGELFEAIGNSEIEINNGAVMVSVTPLDDSKANGTYVADNDDWANGTLTFAGKGVANVSITDYYFCKTTTITVTIIGVDKFIAKLPEANFLYRVGNANTVSLGSLFEAIDGQSIDSASVQVTVNALNDAIVSGEFKPNTSDWTKGTIQFSGTGVVIVSIEDSMSNVFEITLEVVDAVNVTSATNATANNVVLLNDCGFSSLEVSGGYTLYGNGFTMTCGSDSVALDMGYSFVTLNNGTLDNVQIVCPNFDYAALYKSNLTSSDNRSETDANGNSRYYNAKSGVMARGNSQILNSRISGARAAVNVSGGNLVIDNSRIELGAVASILVGAANSLTLRDVTLVQKPTASTYDSNKKLMGFSVLYMCDSEGKATPTTLDGSFVQNAWVNADDKQYVPSAGQDIVDGVMKETAFIHNINGKDSLNLGFAYMPEDAQKTVAAPDNITDNRTDKATIPYEMKDVKIQISILSTTVYVYSYKNTNGTADSFKTESEYKPNKYGDIITVSYSDTADGLESVKSFGTSGWVYELNVDLDKLSGYALDFSKITMSVNGKNITDYKVNGNAKPTSPVAVTAGGTTYTLTATVNGNEYTATYKVTGTETSKESPSLVASNYEAGLCVASSYGGTWHGAAPALQGIQIKYWSVAEKQYKTINLSDYTPTTKGQLNGTNTTWTYSPANGDFTLTLTGGQVHSSNNVYAMPVVCDGKLYFVPAKSTGLVNSGNSARTIPVSYSFKDNNNGDVLTFSHTWSVAENKDAQYNYSDFCNGTLTKLEASGGDGCVTPDTLITLADGTQKRVDELDGSKELLVWNLETGSYGSAPIMFVDSDPETEYEVVKLIFADGTEVKTIYEHGFWDYDLNEYVYVRADNYSDYVGHYFAKQNGNELEKVQLADVVIETEFTMAYSPVTKGHLCYFVNGMLSMPGGVAGLFNIFEVDSETMTYDFEAMQADIETYGLFTYEELNSIVELPESMFNEAGGAYLKISIAKGRMTMDELITMIERYKKFF
ncbi:MAG: hypothetical protein J6C23_08125 [Clostridia bacterium]|nr:hypothetical protein [Clostridia bacterium]